MATCNLHGKYKAGVSVLIPHISLKQFIYSAPVTQEPVTSDCWLEAGGLSLGPVKVDAALALPDPEYHVIQENFLQIHDASTKRLWFLWPGDINSVFSGMCGCVGACAFFGSNRNGVRLFDPSASDFSDSINTAVFHLNKFGDFGYGQSIINTDKLVFESIGGPATPVPSVRSYRNSEYGGSSRGSRRSLDTTTTKTSATLVETNLLRNSVISSISDVGSEQLGSDGTLKGSSTIPSSLPTMSEHESETLSSGYSRVTDDFVPEDTIPDAYDTDKSESSTWSANTPAGSVNSLPEKVKREVIPGHTRNSSCDATTFQRKPHFQANSFDSMRDSKSSIPSSYDPQSLRSSLTSPVLRRLSSQYSEAYDGSGTGSEFYSAAEDMSEGNLSLLSDTEKRRAVKVWANQKSTSSDLSSLTINEDTNLSLSLASSGAAIDKAGLFGTTISTTSTDTESNNSFVSAVSSQHTPTLGSFGNIYDNTLDNIDTESDTTEDLKDIDTDRTELHHDAPTFVDLHGQTNQPITKSRLLMECYQKHMTQLQCKQWNHPPNLQQLLKSHMTLCRTVSKHVRWSHGHYHGGSHAWIPHFVYVKQGFSPSLMASRPQIRPPPSTTSSNCDWDQLNLFRSSTEELQQAGNFVFSRNWCLFPSDYILAFLQQATQYSVVIPFADG